MWAKLGIFWLQLQYVLGMYVSIIQPSWFVVFHIFSWFLVLGYLPRTPAYISLSRAKKCIFLTQLQYILGRYVSIIQPSWLFVLHIFSWFLVLGDLPRTPNYISLSRAKKDLFLTQLQYVFGGYVTIMQPSWFLVCHFFSWLLVLVDLPRTPTYIYLSRAQKMSGFGATTYLWGRYGSITQPSSFLVFHNLS